MFPLPHPQEFGAFFDINVKDVILKKNDCWYTEIQLIVVYWLPHINSNFFM